MKKYYLTAALAGIAVNFTLFAIKLYVGNASYSLTIYCDAVNNMGDTFSCILALLGFIFALRFKDEVRSKRTQSLIAFVISIIIAVTGLFFAYRGLDRLMYPTGVVYNTKYAWLIACSIFAKAALGALLVWLNKKSPSPIISALALDSFLDCLVTLFTLMGMLLVTRVNFAFDAYFAFLCGGIITVQAVRCIIKESKYLIIGE